MVSIHAPRAGRDGLVCADFGDFCRFNPRAPCGARPVRMVAAGVISVFQSTRPVRGATKHPPVRAFRVSVSIHAPRAGRDPQD